MQSLLTFCFLGRQKHLFEGNEGIKYFLQMTKQSVVLGLIPPSLSPSAEGVNLLGSDIVLASATGKVVAKFVEMLLCPSLLSQ